jgi:hypothetical protein
VSLQELQFQEQQEELRRELQQRSTQQLLEQSHYDNSNSKSYVDIDQQFNRRSGRASTSTLYDNNKPQLITNLTNLNYQSCSNYNTINHSSAKDILYELKQYEHFANSTNPLTTNYDQRASNGSHHTRTYSNGGTNYSQNILNYNNSYYKINNINNYNYIKSNQSPTTYHRDQRDEDNKVNSNSWYRHDSSLPNDIMERDSDTMAVERSHLVNNKDREAMTNGHNVTIHNFTNNNVTSHTTSQYNTNIECEECCEEQQQQQQHYQQQQYQQQQQQQNNSNPFNRSQHFTQVSSNAFIIILFLKSHSGE